MKRLNCAVLLKTLAIFLIFVPPITYAKNTYEFAIINHFDKPLFFTITINPNVIPDLQQNFSLAKHMQIKTKVLDLGKESYIRVDDNHSHSAFWGIEIANNKINVHGYIGKGIAYSWSDKKIIFCTPEEFKKNDSCIK